MPAYESATKAAMLHAGKLRAAQAALAAAEYRAQHGEMPEGLEALTPGILEAIPRDPADGKPIRVRRKGDEWRFYSIGPDREDDGGTEEPDRREKDAVFRLYVGPQGVSETF